MDVDKIISIKLFKNKIFLFIKFFILFEIGCVIVLVR